jgi:hypothetical protein
MFFDTEVCRCVGIVRTDILEEQRRSWIALFLTDFYTVEATHSSETSILTRPTWRHIPEDGILQSHRRENLKSYIGL